MASEEILGAAQNPHDAALAHYQYALVLWNEGQRKHKDEYFSRSHDELTKALAAVPNFPDAVFLDGKVLANLRQDDAAKAKFQQYLEMNSGDDPGAIWRVVSSLERAWLRLLPSRRSMAIAFRWMLQGKVVLLDFRATWCGPCREALPHIRDVAKKFQGEPLVILSVSLDSDEQNWKDLVAKNEMTWPQYRDGSFTGSIAKMFFVNATPHTFTVDADGVLQDEHIGDASIEGKLKKLIADPRALQSQSAAKAN